MRSFKQLSYHERRKFFSGFCEGKSVRGIAIELERSPSTVSRGKRRNADQYGYVYAGEAHAMAQERRNKNIPKIDKIKALNDFIIQQLKEKLSPKMIAGSWNLLNPDQPISPEAIYQWIYSAIGEGLGLKNFLLRFRKKRGLKRKQKAPSIKNRISVHDRPEDINKREELGHYEADLIFNKGSQSKNILTLTERVSRFAILIKNENKRSETVIDALIEKIKALDLIIKSITFDNGSEFADHHKLNDLGIKTYFCDPGSPWQKGSIENLNGVLRRYLPFDLLASDIN